MSTPGGRSRRVVPNELKFGPSLLKNSGSSKLHIFWDMENCRMREGHWPQEHFATLIDVFMTKTAMAGKNFKLNAYMSDVEQESLKPPAYRDDLKRLRARTCVHSPRGKGGGRKESQHIVDEHMKQDIREFQEHAVEGDVCVIITGDADFIVPLEQLISEAKVKVVLLSNPSSTSREYIRCQVIHRHADWQAFLDCYLPSKPAAGSQAQQQQQQQPARPAASSSSSSQQHRGGTSGYYRGRGGTNGVGGGRGGGSSSSCRYNNSSSSNPSGSSSNPYSSTTSNRYSPRASNWRFDDFLQEVGLDANLAKATQPSTTPTKAMPLDPRVPDRIKALYDMSEEQLRAHAQSEPGAASAQGRAALLQLAVVAEVKAMPVGELLAAIPAWRGPKKKMEDLQKEGGYKAQYQELLLECMDIKAKLHKPPAQPGASPKGEGWGASKTPEELKATYDELEDHLAARNGPAAARALQELQAAAGAMGVKRLKEAVCGYGVEAARGKLPEKSDLVRHLLHECMGLGELERRVQELQQQQEQQQQQEEEEEEEQQRQQQEQEQEEEQQEEEVHPWIIEELQALSEEELLGRLGEQGGGHQDRAELVRRVAVQAVYRMDVAALREAISSFGEGAAQQLACIEPGCEEEKDGLVELLLDLVMDTGIGGAGDPFDEDGLL